LAGGVVSAARVRLAELLGEVGAAGAASASRTARPDDLLLEVRDVGRIAFPVTVRQAKQLCLVARPARFGKGEQTLLDRGVRDTWEVPRSRVKIDKRQWDKTLGPVLAGLRDDLGLPAGCELTAEFHAMLVYGPGQFFAPHQDSEKSDTMVGTLVVMLPSDSRGGELVVEHAGTSTTYRPSKASLSFVAFYADCRHEVRPVTSGYRVVLTYNLLLRGDTTAAVAGRTDPATVRRLAGLLGKHFATPRRDSAEPPRRLVYLLDHEYTEHGLSWARLKGADVHRAAALSAAAAAAECEAVLALAEIHEVWDAYDDEPQPYGRWDDDWDDDEDDWDDDLSDGPELRELIDSTVHLGHWLDTPGSPASPTSLDIDEDEVCATTPSEKLTPYSAEYQGYMGNYGNTADRWYRRAAIVVWPRRLGFAVRAEASPEWALDTLESRLRDGDLAGAREAAGTLAPFWARSVGANQRSELLATALRVARELDDPGLATLLLAPFRVATLAPEHAAAATGIVHRYGPQWSDKLLAAWFGGDDPWPGFGRVDLRPWFDTLTSVCAAACTQSADGRVLATLLATRSWAVLRRQIDRSMSIVALSRRAEALAALGPAVAAVLVSAATCGATSLRDGVVDFVRDGKDDLLALAMSALRSAASLALDPAVQGGTGLDALAAHCATHLKARLARPERAADDWSIAPPKRCDCGHCATLAAFLRDPARRSYDWRLAEAGRRHIHGVIDEAELPVTHQTRRQGSPYTLVLTKTDVLFARERRQRARDEADLAWLDDQGVRPSASAARRPGRRKS